MWALASRSGVHSAHHSRPVHGKARFGRTGRSIIPSRCRHICGRKTGKPYTPLLAALRDLSRHSPAHVCVQIPTYARFVSSRRSGLWGAPRRRYQAGDCIHVRGYLLDALRVAATPVGALRGRACTGTIRATGLLGSYVLGRRGGRGRWRACAGQYSSTRRCTVGPNGHCPRTWLRNPGQLPAVRGPNPRPVLSCSAGTRIPKGGS